MNQDQNTSSGLNEQNRTGTSTNLSSQTGTPVRNDHYAVISTIYHALQGRDTCRQYEEDALQSGNQELAQFFAEVQQEQLQRANKAKRFLKEWILQEDQGTQGQGMSQSQGMNSQTTH